MERKIELKLVDSNHYWMKGIYLIRIGRLRYVGRSNCIGLRVYQHQLAINNTIKSYSELVNSRLENEDRDCQHRSYLGIAKYLLENPNVEAGTVEVLQREVCSNMMYFTENFYLKEMCSNPDFYNNLDYSPRPKRDEDHVWDAEIKNDRIEYFDPRMKHLRVLSTNNNNQNKEVIKQINEVKNSRQYKMQRLGEWRVRVLGENPTLEMRKVVVEYAMREISRINAS